MKNTVFKFFMLLLIASFISCNSFLDEKTDKKLVTPTTLEDLQAMLDNFSLLNVSDVGEGEANADDYYLPESTWAALSNDYDRRAYIWDHEFTTTHTGWNTVYRYIYFSNLVLEHLEKIDVKSTLIRHEYDNIAGQAYFLRARGHLLLQLNWALSYDELTADTDLGIPLRLNSDFNIKSNRPTTREVYDQIIRDLKIATTLLPNKPQHVLRTSKPAAYALLARTFLFMRDYNNCLAYADSCLAVKSDLIDYNSLDSLAPFPFNIFNEEVIHHTTLRNVHPIHYNRALVDSNLIQMYGNADLRKALFFSDVGDGAYRFRGSYSGSQDHFGGIATNEVYLMRAEAYTRLGNIQSAEQDIKHLLSHRYEAGISIPIPNGSSEDLLHFILGERRKELLMRGLRFPDVKRQNKEGRAIIFRRKLGDEEYQLPPNDLRTAIWISETILERESEILQNPR